MRYVITKENKSLVIDLGKQKIGILLKEFTSVDDFLKFDFIKYKEDYAAFVTPIADAEYFKNQEILQKIAFLESSCIDKNCIIIYSPGDYSPFAGVEVNMFSNKESFAMLMEYQHGLTLYWWGPYNKDLVSKIGEVHVLVGDGAVLHSLVQDTNPNYVVLTGSKEEFSKQFGASEIEDVSKLKLNLKPEDKDLAGLKIISIN